MNKFINKFVIFFKLQKNDLFRYVKIGIFYLLINYFETQANYN